MRTPPFEEAATFIVTLVVLLCAFYGLLLSNAGVDSKVIRISTVQGRARTMTGVT